MYRLLAMCCLVGVALAQPVEDQKEQVTALENTARTLTAAGLNAAATNPLSGLWQVFTKILLTVGLIWITILLITQNIGGDRRRSFARSLASEWNYEEDMLKSVLNSIDPVDMSFRFMEVDDMACRRRNLCELSATPLIGQLIRYISPSISSLKEYQDAMSAGEALEDCALLFAECRDNQFMK